MSFFFLSFVAVMNGLAKGFNETPALLRDNQKKTTLKI
jgi:hypothetical protein